MYYISCVILISGTLLTTQPKNSSRVFTYINQGQTDSLSTFLEDHDVNGRYGLDSITLLSYSILTGQTKSFNLLLKNGADVNQKYLGSTPLILAVLEDQARMVRRLIRNGANLDARDPKGNTALIHAASRGNITIARNLVRSGADINYRNPRNDKAYDAAVKSNFTEMASYLREQYEKNLPPLRDGPFVKWQRNKVRAYYLVHDSVKQITRKRSRKFNAAGDSFQLNGFAGDTMKYQLRRNFDTPGHDFNNVSRLMALGDIHGGYDSLLMFLINHRVINKQHRWIWGNGHLVFMGDIFDRGEKVTEALWFIYQLEADARKKGGRVHMILGNHEIMNFREDHNYVSDKYYYLTDKVNTSYGWLFNRNTILGSWLRSRNTILRINDNLFVHAGISPELAYSGLSIEEVNEIVRFLNQHPERNPYSEEVEKLLFDYKGPFWYRGYLEESKFYDRISYRELKKILRIFDVSRIFIGHTNVKNITPLYNKRVFPLDVPFYTYGYQMEGILIAENIIYLLKSSGEKVQVD